MSNPDLLSYSYNITSEHGEDGTIKRIFEIIGEESRWCVDLGALNGIHGSNVWNLMKKQGWSGVFIEADQTYFEKLKIEFKDIKQAHCINAFVSFYGENSLDKIFSQTPLPKNFDLFSLDIDGNEYHLWESLTLYRPRVMVIEFNPTIPNEVNFIQPCNMEIFQGSSLKALVELGKRKGYELIAANKVNAFFVVKELFPWFGILDNSIDKIHTDRSYETKLFQLYDGTLRISGFDRLLWHNIPISIEKLQVLSWRKRFYPAKVNQSENVRKLKYWIRKSSLYPLVRYIKTLIKKI